MRFLLVVGLAGLACCCALGAPAFAQDASLFKVLKLEGHQVRWLPPGNGSARVVTYRLITETADFPGARNCRKLTRLDGLMATSELSATAVKQEIAAAFAMWEAAAHITFREASEGEPADIVIGAQVDPEGWAFADVFFNAASPETMKPISRALVCLNPLKRWKIGFDGDLKTYDLRYTLAHEIGHAMGLDHPSGGGQIMGYRYEERFRALQPGDVRGAVLLYGAPRGQPDAMVASGPLRNDTLHTSAARRLVKRWESIKGRRALSLTPAE